MKARQSVCGFPLRHRMRWIACLLTLLGCGIVPGSQLLAQPMPEDPSESTPVDPEQVAASTNELPMFADLSLPSLNELLEQEPRDWVLLFGGRVLSIPAISPRPDHLEWLIAGQKAFYETRPAGDQLPADWLEQYKEFNWLTIEVPDEGIEQDYRLHTRYIEKILYHEDLALLKADQLIKAGELTSAYRLINFVAQRAATNNRRRIAEQLLPIEWPNLLKTQRQLLVAEVAAAQANQQWQRAFNKLRIHHEFDPDYDRLPKLTANLLDDLGTQLFEQHSYRQLRFHIQQARQLFPNLPQINQWNERMLNDAKATMAQASQAANAQQPRKAALLGRRSLEIWPFDLTLQRQYQPLQARYPIIRVGVIADHESVPRFQPRLHNQEWFTVESLKEGYPRYRSRFIESWAPYDLGRGFELNFHHDKQPADSQPRLQSRDFLATLAAATIEPAPDQLGLFASSLAATQPRSPAQLSVQLRQQTAHPLGLLAAMFHHAAPAESSQLTNLFFRPFPEPDDVSIVPPTQSAVRAYPVESSIPRPYVQEVQTFVYADQLELLRGLFRDECDYLPDVPLPYLAGLQQDKRFAVHRYQIPLTTVLQFHLHGQLGAHPEARLALLTDLNRDELLTELLGDDSPARPFYRISDSITPSRTHAWLPASAAIQYDPIASRALMTLLLKNPDLPRQLTLQAPADQRYQPLVDRIVTRWKQLGIDTTVQTSAEPTSWDVRLRVVDMLAPQYELPGLLTESGRVSTADLASFPTPLKRRLLELERSRDWDEINTALTALQTELIVSSWMLPLWERDAFGLVRREIRGLPQQFLRPCQQLDHWTISPVIASQ